MADEQLPALPASALVEREGFWRPVRVSRSGPTGLFLERLVGAVPTGIVLSAEEALSLLDYLSANEQALRALADYENRLGREDPFESWHGTFFPPPKDEGGYS